MPQGTVQGDHVRLRDVRNFDWRGDADYDARWDTRDYDLSRLRSVDMILSTWGMPAIAHTLVSFGFDDGQRVVFSVEIRKERGEQFSELGGFFKQFELSVIAADERDIVRVRTAVRGETVSIYPIRMPPEAMRALFLSYVDTANALRAEPRFYHTVTANCTTIIYQMVRAIVPGLPVDYRLLLSGYLPEYLYEHGGLDTSRPLDAIRRDADITQRAARAGNTPAFSQAIREPFLSPDHEAFPRARRALRRAAADPGDRRLRRRQGRVRQHAGLHRPTTRRRAHHRQAQRRRQRGAGRAGPGRRQMPRVRAQLHQRAARQRRPGHRAPVVHAVRGLAAARRGAGTPAPHRRDRPRRAAGRLPAKRALRLRLPVPLAAPAGRARLRGPPDPGARLLQLCGAAVRHASVLALPRRAQGRCRAAAKAPASATGTSTS